MLYKKLMGQPVGLEDLAELQPEVHASLTKLLAMGEEELAGLGLVFQVGRGGQRIRGLGFRESGCRVRFRG